MATFSPPYIKPGHVYRTKDFRQWSANPARLAKRLVHEGTLRRAAQGLFYAPLPTRFGPAPPDETEILRAFFAGNPFLVSGPPKWNALGLGATAMFATTLIYNTRRTGNLILDGRRYLLRRVLFPENASPEYFVVDLLQQHNMAGMSLPELEHGLVATLNDDRWNENTLIDMAKTYGSKSTLALVERALREAGKTL